MTTETKKPGGRPTKSAAQALDAKLLAAAHRSFVTRGFTGTSMTAVAAEAKVGKQTLYRRYQSKAELLHAVVYHRIKTSSAIPDIPVDADDPIGELRRIARSALDVVMDADFVTLHRVLISEVRAFPELAAYAGQWGGMHVERSAAALQRAMRAGRVPEGDAVTMATSFLWGMMGDLLYTTLMGAPPPADMAERERLFEAKWEVSGFAHIAPEG